MTHITSADVANASPMPPAMIAQIMPGGAPPGYMPMVVGAGHHTLGEKMHESFAKIHDKFHHTSSSAPAYTSASMPATSGFGAGMPTMPGYQPGMPATPEYPGATSSVDMRAMPGFQSGGATLGMPTPEMPTVSP